MPRSTRRSHRRGRSRQTRSLAEAEPNAIRITSVAGLGGVLLLAVVLAAYANHFHNSFHMDDAHTIVNNAAIRDLRNIPVFFRDATTFGALPTNQSYRPLVSTLLAIDYQLSHGLYPFCFHLSIFALFIALALLLAFIIHHLLEINPATSSHRWIAAVAAAWYALHPANADTINYITAASGELISALGVVGSFAIYFAFPKLRRYYLYTLPAAIAILAKPTAAIFVVLFAMFRLLFPPSTLAGRRPRALTWFAEVVPAFVICGALLIFVQHMTPRSWSGGAASAFNYRATQPYVTLLYFKAFFWPARLTADYDLKPFVTAADPRFWIGCRFAVVITVAAIVAAVFNKTRLIGFGLLWFLIALLPTSLLPLAEVMNCYRTFLPYMGLVIAMAGAAALLAARLGRPRWVKTVATGAVALFLGANAYATFQRNKAWRTDETLWYDAVSKSPRDERALMGYGARLLDKGDFAGAIDYFHRAQQLAPRYPALLINLAIAEDAIGQSAAAEQHFQEALQLAPSLPGPYNYYARYLIEHSRSDEARALLHKALELSPNDLTTQRFLNEAEMRTMKAQSLSAPTQVQGGIHIGRDNDRNKDGDPGSSVRKKFACGNEQDKWCTIHLVISFYEADNEWLKITLTGEGDNKKTVFLKKGTMADPNTLNSQQFAVSVKGCTECEVTIEVTEGYTKNIQSWANVTPPGSSCTDIDMTGGEGTVDLVNEQGEDIPRPSPNAH
jgi:tetratricopeptide (TPR) repeat protein